MKTLCFKMLSVLPFLEVMIRRLFYRLKDKEWFKNIININKNDIVIKPCTTKADIQLFSELITAIRGYGIKNGDILIVHSSMGGLKEIGATPKQIIDELLELVGEDGTLVFPAYPQFREKDKIITGDGTKILAYDPKKTLSSTGMMPNIFCRYPGTIRSEFPYNPLSAKGRLAKEMMSDNLNGDLPHGKHSAWGYCVEHHAKILFLGIPAYHSNTVVHVAEDFLDEVWPIADWYRNTNYIVKVNDENRLIKVRQPNHFWARFIPEHYNIRLLKKEYLLTEDIIRGVNIGFIHDSKLVVDYLIIRALRGRLSYWIPRKYWKKLI